MHKVRSPSCAGQLLSPPDDAHSYAVWPTAAAAALSRDCVVYGCVCECLSARVRAAGVLFYVRVYYLYSISIRIHTHTLICGLWGPHQHHTESRLVDRGFSCTVRMRSVWRPRRLAPVRCAGPALRCDRHCCAATEGAHFGPVPAPKIQLYPPKQSVPIARLRSIPHARPFCFCSIYTFYMQRCTHKSQIHEHTTSGSAAALDFFGKISFINIILFRAPNNYISGS